MRLILELAAGKSNALEIMIPALGHLGNAAILRGFKNVASASFLLNLKPQEGWFVRLFNIQRVLTIYRESDEMLTENTALRSPGRLLCSRDDNAHAGATMGPHGWRLVTPRDHLMASAMLPSARVQGRRLAGQAPLYKC